MWDCSSPPNSGISAFYVEESNVWLDEDGEEYADLTQFGFTPLQRDTILVNMRRYPDAHYLCCINNYGELVEISYGLIGD